MVPRSGKCTALCSLQALGGYGVVLGLFWVAHWMGATPSVSQCITRGSAQCSAVGTATWAEVLAGWAHQHTSLWVPKSLRFQAEGPSRAPELAEILTGCCN